MFTCASQGGVVGIVSRLVDGRFGIRIPTRERRVSLLQNVQTTSYTQPASYLVGTNRVVKLTSHLDIVPRLRMSGDMPQLPLTPSWHGQRQLYLIFIFTYITVVFVKVKGDLNRSGMRFER